MKAVNAWSHMKIKKRLYQISQDGEPPWTLKHGQLGYLQNRLNFKITDSCIESVKEALYYDITTNSLLISSQLSSWLAISLGKTPFRQDKRLCWRSNVFSDLEPCSSDLTSWFHPYHFNKAERSSEGNIRPLSEYLYRRTSVSRSGHKQSNLITKTWFEKL